MPEVAIAIGSFLLETLFTVSGHRVSEIIKEGEFNRRLKSIVNNTIIEFKIQHPIKNSNPSQSPFYDFQAFHDELLKFKFEQKETQPKISSIRKALENNTAILPPSDQDIINFLQIFESKLNQDEVLREIERNNDYINEIYEISKGMEEMKGQLNNLTTQISGAQSSAPQNPMVIDIISNQTNQEIKSIEAIWKKGNPNEALNQVESLKKNKEFCLPEICANLLYLEARIRYFTEEIQQAEELLQKLEAEHPGFDYFPLKAIILFNQEKQEEALQVLEDRNTPACSFTRAILYLTQSQTEHFYTFYSSNKDLFHSSPEGLRIIALYYRMTGDFNKATETIDKSIKLKPEWTNLLFAKGLIYFSASISGSVLLNAFVPQPFYFPSERINTDKTSQNSLFESERIFTQLASNDQQYFKNIETYQAWRLFVLSYIPGKEQETKKYCTELITQDPTNKAALMCLFQKNYDIDIKPSIVSLRKDFENTNELSSLLFLLGCLAIEENYESGISLVIENENLFRKNKSVDLWHYWIASFYLSQSDLSLAKKCIEKIEDDLFKIPLNTRILHLNSSQINMSEEQHFIECYRKTSDITYLIYLCELWAKQNDWKKIGDYITDLEKFSNNHRISNMYIQTLYNTGKFKKSLEASENARNLFDDKFLPPNLTMIEIYCFQKLGNFKEAFHLAKINYENSKGKPSFKYYNDLLFNLSLQAGKHHEAVLLAKEGKDNKIFTDEELIQIASKLKPFDDSSAAELIKDISTENLKEEYLTNAFTLLHSLGKDEMASSLIFKMQQPDIQSRCGIKSFKINELLNIFEDIRSQEQERSEAYLKGKLSTHLFIKNPLLQLHVNQEFNGNSPIYTCHAGLPYDLKLPENITDFTIFIDIISLIVLENLDLLDLLSKKTSPLWIPFNTMDALRELKSNIQPIQPSVFEKKHELLKLLTSRRIKTISYLGTTLPNSYEKLKKHCKKDLLKIIHKAVIEKNYALITEIKDFSNSQIVALPEFCKNHILFKENIPHFIDNLPSENKPKIYSDLLTLESLSTFDLKKLTMSTQIFIPQNEELELRRFFDIQKPFFKETEQKIQDMINHISEMIDKETIRIIPPSPKNDENNHLNLCLSGLFSKTEDQPTNKPLYFIDDRLIGSLFHKQHPVANTFHLLRYFKSQQMINEKEYYEKLSKMRKGLLFFIPIEHTEILYYLNQVQINNKGCILESDELTILKKYVSQVLLNAEQTFFLSEDNDDEQHSGETKFLFQMRTEILKACIEIFKDQSKDIALCMTLSSWILDNLYIDFHDIVQISNSKFPEKSHGNLLPFSFANLLLTAFFYCPPHRWKDCLSFLETEFFLHNTLGSTDIINEIWSFLKKPLSTLDISGKSLLSFFLVSFPDKIRNALLQNENIYFLKEYNLEPSISIDGFEVPEIEYLQSMLKAKKKKWTTVTDKLTKDSLLLKTNVETTNSGSFKIEGNESEKVITDPILPIFLKDQEKEILTFLNTQRDFFDCPDDEALTHMKKIAKTEDPILRYDLINDQIDNSTIEFYQRIDFCLRNRDSLNLKDFIPNNLVQVFYFFFKRKIQKEKKKKNLTDNKAFSTCRTKEDFYSLTRYPTLLQPDSQLDFSSQEIDEMIRNLQTPVQKLHLLHFLLNSSRKTVKEKGTQYLESLLCDNFIREINDFITLFTWMENSMDSSTDFEQLDKSDFIYLIWAHCSEIYSILKRFNFSENWISELFNQPIEKMNINLFDKEYYYVDNAQALSMNKLTLFLYGLTYAIKSTSNISGNTLKKTKEFITQLVKDNQPLTSLFYLQNPTIFSNRLNTFFAMGKSKTRFLFLNDENNQILTEENLSIEEFIEALKKDVNKPISWGILSEIIPLNSFNHKLRRKLQYYYMKIDFNKLENNDLFSLFKYLGSFYPKFGNKSLSENSLKQLIDLLKKEMIPLNQENTSLITEFIKTISILSKNPTKNILYFGENILQFIERVPKTRKYLVLFLNKLIKNIPLEARKPFIKALLIARIGDEN